MAGEGDFGQHTLATSFDQTSRLLSIAPELRLVIYELLLCRDDGHSNGTTRNIASEHSDFQCNGHSDLQKSAAIVPVPVQFSVAHPALLRTCKQVYAEARDVLYSQSSFTIRAFFTLWPTFSTSTRYTTYCIRGDERLMKEVSVQEFVQHWSRRPHLLQVGRLTIRINLVDRRGCPFHGLGAYPPVNHMLYILGCALQRSPNNMRELRIELYPETRELYPRQLVEPTFYPITKIPLNIDLQLVGFDETAVSTITNMRRSRMELCRFDALSALERLKPLVQSQLDYAADHGCRDQAEWSDLRSMRKLMAKVQGVLGSRRYLVGESKDIKMMADLKALAELEQRIAAKRAGE